MLVDEALKNNLYLIWKWFPIIISLCYETVNRIESHFNHAKISMFPLCFNIRLHSRIFSSYEDYMQLALIEHD